MQQYQNPKPSKQLQTNVKEVHKQAGMLADNIEQVIKGKRSVIELVIAALMADGHILLRDVPGVGKTLLAKSLSKSIDTHFKRIQFTPDLLPTDITGVNVFDPSEKKFEFQQGPVFTNILLADEINRASPKTQSALLEAMEERQVSVDNIEYKLPDLFFVIATKNPIEHAGTYPLPAAQLDRFMMRLTIGYPEKETEMEILNLHTQNKKLLDEVKPVITAENVLAWQKVCNEIYTAPTIDNYLVDLARETRELQTSGHGVSPRATILLKKAARAIAILNNRDYVIPDDVQKVIKQVFAHRMTGSGTVGEAVVDEILEKVTIS